MSVQFRPLKSHFYIVKLGFIGVYIIFLILLLNRLCVLIRTTGVLTSIHNLSFLFSENKKNITFFPVKIAVYCVNVLM